MGGAALIATAKSFAIGFLLVPWKARIAVLVAVVYIGTAVIVEVLARAFNAVAKSLALDVLQILGRRIPCATILGVGS